MKSLDNRFTSQVDFNIISLVSLHSLKTMGIGPFGASTPLFSRNGELLGYSPIHYKGYVVSTYTTDHITQ
jgi:hypothetical protein